MPDSKKPVFNFNQNDNKARSAKKNKLIALTRVVRSGCRNITKCVLYSTDRDASKIYSVPAASANEYAVIEMFGDKVENKIADGRKFDLLVKTNQAHLLANKYKVVAQKNFNDKEYPICKFIVKI